MLCYTRLKTIRVMKITVTFFVSVAKLVFIRLNLNGDNM